MDYQPSISMLSIHRWQLKPALLKAAQALREGRATRLIPAQSSSLHLYANEALHRCEGGATLFTRPSYALDEATHLYCERVRLLQHFLINVQVYLERF